MNNPMDPEKIKEAKCNPSPSSSSYSHLFFALVALMIIGHFDRQISKVKSVLKEEMKGVTNQVGAIQTEVDNLRWTNQIKELNSHHAEKASRVISEVDQQTKR